MSIADIVAAQRSAPWNALTVEERRAALLRLKEIILDRQEAICEALQKDLGKSPCEAYMTEIGMVLTEIGDAVKHLKAWAKPRRVPTPIAQFPARSFMLREPYGVVLIMAPWNYPFQLTLSPLVGAFAAGNRCVLKPSNDAPHTTAIIQEIIAKWMPPEFVAVVTGGRLENQALLDERFDYIFFTGGVTVGKLVLEKAAKHATPVTLELGGKSPCIVDETADIAVAARRIAFGKALNSGQTCVAPDYLYVHQSVAEPLMQAIKACWQQFYGDALQCDQWPKMVNQKHYNRVMGLIKNETVYYGGRGDGQRISPTLLTGITWDSPAMQEEVFGPVLPVLLYDDIKQVISAVNAHEKPLALYLFTGSKETEDAVLGRVSFGGGCVNDTIIHLATPHMPFGGVGHSGMGGYHGKFSFDTFSHTKSIVKKANWLDLPMRYPPFDKKKQQLIEKFMK